MALELHCRRTVEQPHSGDMGDPLQLFLSDDDLASRYRGSSSGDGSTDVDARDRLNHPIDAGVAEPRRSSSQADVDATANNRRRRKTFGGSLVWPLVLFVAAVASGGVGYLYGRSDALRDADERSNEEPRRIEAGMVTGEPVGNSSSSATGEPSVATNDGPTASAVPPHDPSAPAPIAERSWSETQASAPAAPATVDVTGDWTISTVVEGSSVPAFVGLGLGYEIWFQQRNAVITGGGVKVIENGTAVTSGGRTPISVRGRIDGDRLSLSFTEKGTGRESSGTFVMFAENPELLRGRFASNAANSTGRIEARRRM